jgi:hypothetical protein
MIVETEAKCPRCGSRSFEVWLSLLDPKGEFLECTDCGIELERDASALRFPEAAPPLPPRKKKVRPKKKKAAETAPVKASRTAVEGQGPVRAILAAENNWESDGGDATEDLVPEIAEIETEAQGEPEQAENLDDELLRQAADELLRHLRQVDATAVTGEVTNDVREKAEEAYAPAADEVSPVDIEESGAGDAIAVAAREHALDDELVRLSTRSKKGAYTVCVQSPKKRYLSRWIHDLTPEFEWPQRCVRTGTQPAEDFLTVRADNDDLEITVEVPISGKASKKLKGADEAAAPLRFHLDREHNLLVFTFASRRFFEDFIAFNRDWLEHLPE